MTEEAGNPFPKEDGGNYPIKWRATAVLLLVVCINRKVVGVIELQDIIKPGIEERFERLRKMGVKTVMVTGDNPQYSQVYRRKSRCVTISSRKPSPKIS